MSRTAQTDNRGTCSCWQLEHQRVRLFLERSQLFHHRKGGYSNCIYRYAFLHLYGTDTCSRNCLVLCDEDESEYGSFENQILISCTNTAIQKRNFPFTFQEITKKPSTVWGWKKLWWVLIYFEYFCMSGMYARRPCEFTQFRMYARWSWEFTQFIHSRRSCEFTQFIPSVSVKSY